jgi:hypothetical protein
MNDRSAEYKDKSKKAFNDMSNNFSKTIEGKYSENMYDSIILSRL